MNVYKDVRHNHADVLVMTPTGRKVLGPYQGMPVPMFRWSSLDVVYTTFSGGGTCFTIRETTVSGRVLEDVVTVTLNTFKDALALGLEGFIWEGWDQFLKQWVPQARPNAFRWTGTEFQGMAWRDE